MPGDKEAKSSVELNRLLQNSKTQNRLPTIVLLENHDNPNLENFYNEILPILKTQGYKKFLTEAFPDQLLDAAYFDKELVELEYQLCILTKALNTIKKLDLFNSKNDIEKYNFLLKEFATMSKEEAIAMVRLPKVIAAITYFKKIPQFGFNIFGTETGLHSSSPLSLRDPLIANTIIKHHNAIGEGGVLMRIGFLHFPGIRQHLIENDQCDSDYIFIYLMHDADMAQSYEEWSSVIQESYKYSTFKLIQIRLDSSNVDVAVRNVLSKLSPHINKGQIGRMTALKVRILLEGEAEIIKNTPMNRETAFNVGANLNEQFYRRHDAATALQALMKGYLLRKKALPLLKQFHKLQTTYQIVAGEETRLQENIISAARGDYDAVLRFTGAAIQCKAKKDAAQNELNNLKQHAFSTTTRFS